MGGQTSAAAPWPPPPAQAPRYRRAGGAFVRLMGDQASATGSYRLPSLSHWVPSAPPQINMLLPVQTAIWSLRAEGAPAGEVGVQLSVTGSYRPPLSSRARSVEPPPPTMTLPFQTAEWPARPLRANGLQVSSGRHAGRLA